MGKIYVPPIKCQGIKTKLVPLILANVSMDETGVWHEPFLGSGVVGFNLQPKRARFSDINPHVINFYTALQASSITPGMVRAYLEQEGKKLARYGETHYYAVRDRFNRLKAPLDFLFLSRSCFNGMIRFNKRGHFNVPFCKKPERFSPAYITKIVNQVDYAWKLVRDNEWSFSCKPFEKAIPLAKNGDVIYCDPPYLGRHVDYYNSWSDTDEERLHAYLSRTPASFILSTWHSNKYRKNVALEKFWADFEMVTKGHFYHVGASENNRHAMTEALIMNFPPLCYRTKEKAKSASLAFIFQA